MSYHHTEIRLYRVESPLDEIGDDQVPLLTASSPEELISQLINRRDIAIRDPDNFKVEVKEWRNHETPLKSFFKPSEEALN